MAVVAYCQSFHWGTITRSPRANSQQIRGRQSIRREGIWHDTRQTQTKRVSILCP